MVFSIRHRRGRRAARCVGSSTVRRLTEVAGTSSYGRYPTASIEILRMATLSRTSTCSTACSTTRSIYAPAEVRARICSPIQVDCVVASGTLGQHGELPGTRATNDLAAATLRPRPRPSCRRSTSASARTGRSASRPRAGVARLPACPSLLPSQVIAAENRDFGRHPRELFWPVEGGVEIHSVFHPSALHQRRRDWPKYRRNHFANIDLWDDPAPVHASRADQAHGSSLACVNNFTAAHRKYEDDRAVLHLRGLPALPRLDLPGAEGLLHPGAAPAVPSWSATRRATTSPRTCARSTPLFGVNWRGRRQGAGR